MSHIYKVYHNIDNCYPVVYIFAGSLIVNQSHSSLVELQDAYDMNPGASEFNNLFSNSELETINRCSAKVIFLDEHIHIDDTIETIKKKLMKNIDDLIFEEIYLYAKKTVTINSSELYSNLTLNNKLDLTQIGRAHV